MKKRHLVLFMIIAVCLKITAQPPNGFSYQAVLRDAAGTVRANTPVSIEISILQENASGTEVFSETHGATTNSFGLVNLEIGSVNPAGFAIIDWADGPYFMQLSVDGTEMGTSQLLSVPYALHAKTADNISNFNSLQLNGIGLPYTYGPNPAYVGTEGSFIGFGHDGVSEDFIGYKNNTFYFKDSPEGADITDPDVVVGGKLGVGTEILDDMLEVDGDIDIHNNTVKNLADPVNAQDAATKAYVDLKVKTYQVGDFAYGGIVFWIDETGQHGLVCAKTDQSTTTEVTEVRWYAGTYGYTHALGNGPLAGKLNTAIIIAAQTAYSHDDGATYAARICNELKITEGGKTYGDWYLPSTDELNLMFQSRTTINTTAQAHGGASFINSYYWSSTENNYYSAWTQNFNNGELIDYYYKSNKFRVRAVREF